MNVTRGYVLGLSVWVLAAGCQRSLGDSATGQVAGASGAKSVTAAGSGVWNIYLLAFNGDTSSAGGGSTAASRLTLLGVG